ncbi:MAG: S1 RNA-binding domain-containing protein, partial [Planctomycetales bacterium]|nr:S1 RNA-binding domain-containing protein [Planctomycetales bacterium]
MSARISAPSHNDWLLLNPPNRFRPHQVSQMSDSAEEANVTTSENTPPASSEPHPHSDVAHGETAANNAPPQVAEHSDPIASQNAASDTPAVASSGPPSSGPLSLDKIRQLRQSQQAAKPQQRERGREQRSSPVGSDANRGSGSDRAPSPEHKPLGSTATSEAAQTAGAASAPGDGDAVSSKPTVGSSTPRHDARSRKPGRRDAGSVIPTPEPLDTRSKIAIPSLRQPLSQDLEHELNAALGGSDLDKLLVGDAMLQVGHELEEGQRISATVMKARGEFVFVSLGAPNEGVVPSLSFETLPEEGATLDVIVRGYLASEGLYEVSVVGSAVDVSDWSDLNEGEVVEAVVTGANAGGLECKVGHIQGFIPASQAAEYRIETLADFVGQKLLCVVTEANPRRGNLVLSHRAVLEREKKEKREERLASLEIGAAVEGVVRKILDFGAFVDIGGLDGLLHISQLS